MAIRTLLAVAAACTLAAPALAQAQLRAVPDEAWCSDEYSEHDRARTCTVYEGTWPASGRIEVDARPNGGIRVNGWNRNEVRLRAKVVTMADDEAEARQIASQVRIQTGATIRAEGPSRADGGHRSWWVSYRLDVPSASALSLRSSNGGIHLADVHGDISFNTTNGGLHLKAVSGNVNGATTNGGVHVDLDGTEWRGEGLELTTTNGGVHLSVPRGYNAHLEVGTTNGRLHANLPDVKLEDDEEWGPGRRRRARNLSADLGSGGRPIRIRTTNGSVHLNQE